MTDIETRLAEILTEEAHSHEPPKFDAFAIADRVETDQSRRTRRSLRLAAALVTAAVVTAGAVYGIGGARSRLAAKPSAPRLTMTFAYDSVQAVGGYAVQQIIAARVKAAGVPGLTAHVVQPDPTSNAWTVTVSGDPADRIGMTSLVASKGLRLGLVVDPAQYGLPHVLPASDCEGVKTGAVWEAVARDSLSLVCTADGSQSLLLKEFDEGFNKVTARVVPHASGGASPGTGWAVEATFDPAGARHLANLTEQAYQSGGRIALVMGETSYMEPIVAQGPITSGVVDITGDFTQNSAKMIAAALDADVPGDMPIGFALVSTR